jgi:hypothetical protein
MFLFGTFQNIALGTEDCNLERSKKDADAAGEATICSFDPQFIPGDSGLW